MNTMMNPASMFHALDTLNIHHIPRVVHVMHNAKTAEGPHFGHTSSTRGMNPFLELLTLKFLEIKNISRERFKSLVYGGVYRFCRTWSIFFQTYVCDVMSLWQ